MLTVRRTPLVRRPLGGLNQEEMMTIKTLLPEQNCTIDKLDWWLEKREDIKQRFLDNIGTPVFSRNTRAIETIETIDDPPPVSWTWS